MRSFFTSLVFILLLTATVHGFESERKIRSLSELLGVWQIVEFDPKTQDDPLKSNHSYVIFLPNMTIVDVHIPKDKKKEPWSSVKPFTFKESALYITHHPNDIEWHRVVFIGKRLKFEVPFGSIHLEQVTNQ